MRNGLLPAQGIQRPHAIAASKDWPRSIGECEDLPRTIARDAKDEKVGLGEIEQDTTVGAVGLGQWHKKQQSTQLVGLNHRKKCFSVGHLTASSR